MTQDKRMRTWAEIDLDALEHNYRALRALTAEHCRFLGLVKADAYGHGAVAIGRKLQSLGAEMLAVASVQEGAQLRQAGITTPILCLGHTSVEQAEVLLGYDLTQTVEDLDTGRALSQAAVAAGKRLRIHVKLDTGMGRLGFLWRAGVEHGAVVEDITALCALPGLEAEGLFTHFSDADGSQSYTMEQLEGFLQARQSLEQNGVSFMIYHCSSSAAVLQYPCTHMDMIRPGISLYGYYPAPGLKGSVQPDLKPVMAVKSRIATIHDLSVGSCISYGRTATLSRDSRIAVVPIGYGDGYPRRLSNRMEMRIDGALCPVVGRVCMDMCMVDVTDLPQVKAGDVAVVYDGQLAEQAAQVADTIVYELLCAVSPRVPRIYLERGREIDVTSSQN